MMNSDPREIPIYPEKMCLDPICNRMAMEGVETINII
jgi:hypothetical protein